MSDPDLHRRLHVALEKMRRLVTEHLATSCTCTGYKECVKLLEEALGEGQGR